MIFQSTLLYQEGIVSVFVCTGEFQLLNDYFVNFQLMKLFSFVSTYECNF